MKNSIHFTIPLLFIFTFSAFAQIDTVWYDTNWKKTVKNNASFYRAHIEKKDNGFWIVDNYVSGSKQMEGLSLNKDKEVYDGLVKWFHENGNTFQIVNYKGGILNGKRLVYFEDGKLKSETNYKDGKMDGQWKEFYENGNLKEVGTFENGQKEGAWETFYDSGKTKDQGRYVFDRKVDIWKTNYYDGTLENE